MYRQLLVLCGIIFICGACSKAPYLPYHSTAGIDHQTRMVETNMKLMNSDENDTDRLSYAVIAALDNGELPYVLIAPSKSSNMKTGFATGGVGAGKKLWDYNVSYSTTIHPEKVNELIKGLDIILEKWNQSPTEKDGYFFEFTHTPEHRVFEKSEEVIAKLPTINVNFNITAKGSAGSLAIGEGDLRYLYKFEEIRDVQNFKMLLEKALEELRDM